MRASLRHTQMLDRRSALTARFACPAIHLEPFLHPAAGVDPIERCAAVADRQAEHVPDSLVQPADLLVGQAVGPLERM